MKHFFLLILFSFSIFLNTSFATHIMGGEITIQGTQIQTDFAVQLTLYLDSAVVVNNPVLDENTALIDFGDGTSKTIPVTTKIYIGGNTIKMVYQIVHTYVIGGPDYHVSYKEYNRNKYIVNINGTSGVNSDAIPFYIEAYFTTKDLTGSPATAQFSNYKNLVVLPKRKFTAIIAAAPGVEGDSLSYSLVVPLVDKNKQVPFYLSPGDTIFRGNSDSAKTQIFTLNPTTGELVWDAPYFNFPTGIQYALYNVAVEVKTWRKNANNQYAWIAYTTRDFLIKVSPTGVAAVISSFEDFFDVFPNPTNLSFTLKSKLLGNENLNINILNSLGQEVLHTQSNAQTSSLDAQELSPGIYTLHVSTGRQVWSKKLVKQ